MFLILCYNIILIKRSRKGNFLKNKNPAVCQSKKVRRNADFFLIDAVQLSDRSKHLNIVQSLVGALIAGAAFHNRCFSGAVKPAHFN